MSDDRKAALDNALKKIEKNFGKGSIMRMGDKADTRISTVPTGSLSLDEALGVGGFPRGRIVEIYGPESSGKTTVALHAVAEVQKRGGTAAYIDAENALDPAYAQALGVNIDELLLSQPDTGEQGLEICDALVSSGAIDIVVVDSVAALVPRAEIEGEMGDTHVGLQARLMSQALRKLSGTINKTNTIAAPAPLFDHGNSLFSLGGTDIWDNQKAFDEYARTLLPLAYDDFFAAAKSAMKPRHRTMLHKLLDFHFDRRATRYNLPPNRLKMIEKEVQRRARVLLG